MTKKFTLIGPDGLPYESERPGTIGGNKKSGIYGRLDCRSANRYVAAGTYQKSRVFFADESDAVSAGFRPCAVCMPAAYREWKMGGSHV